jgi:hypothetical protein
MFMMGIRACSGVFGVVAGCALLQAPIPVAFSADSQDDWRKYDQPGPVERSFTWREQAAQAAQAEEGERWKRDDAQCRGNATIELAKREHLCAMHGRCEVGSIEDDRRACMAGRGHRQEKP